MKATPCPFCDSPIIKSLVGDEWIPLDVHQEVFQGTGDSTAVRVARPYYADHRPLCVISDCRRDNGAADALRAEIVRLKEEIELLANG